MFSLPLDIFDLKNPGVDKRNKIDKLENFATSEARRTRLEEKARLYEEIESGKIKLPQNHQFLVDFDKQREMDDVACTVQEEEGVTRRWKEREKGSQRQDDKGDGSDDGPQRDVSSDEDGCQQGKTSSFNALASGPLLAFYGLFYTLRTH
ncbi:hypothetical protein BEWA_049530 [Theileria equi strain WA]|uniref:Uncharacterized protein n=1 Tax=Theileria equi strain WA TaxID=1537102 RepID=L1LAY1_THEEQ|nr:hypothetical protein BEWA_049530 [Theileria equi strain WA]EKX72486.1 hypothetical protein BEWA_049530 [Theileria equi strain WA]|eukprot:XP_004831938.1 hypothetical protein BEWA_049530 [Theileria equi strain WA]